MGCVEQWDLFDTFTVEDKLVVKDKCKEYLFCESCNTEVGIVLDDGNYVCKFCGDLISHLIDVGAEWRYYGADDSKGNDPTRCGLPTSELLPDSSLGSVIGYGSNETRDIRIMRKYHMWNSMTYKERCLYNIFDTLTINSVNNGLTKSIIDEAKMLYKKISEMRLSRGENRSGLIASSVYMACKLNKVPRSAKEIAKMFHLKPTTMTRGCKKFQDIMKLKIESTNPDDFVSRFCSKLEFSTERRDICRRVIKIADDMGIVCENTPPSVAAGTIYMSNIVLHWGVSKKILSEACEISQVTISKCYKRLSEYEKVLFADFQNSTSVENS
jgi:transcription initiation factor TFIIB